jgi:hypothetical protein
MVYCGVRRENAGQRKRTRSIVQGKSPALAGMGDMHVSAGAPTRAPGDRRARRADEVPLQSSR